MFYFLPYSPRRAHLPLLLHVWIQTLRPSLPPAPPPVQTCKRKRKRKTILIVSSNEYLNFKKLLLIPFAHCTLGEKGRVLFPGIFLFLGRLTQWENAVEEGKENWRFLLSRTFIPPSSSSLGKILFSPPIPREHRTLPVKRAAEWKFRVLFLRSCSKKVISEYDYRLHSSCLPLPSLSDVVFAALE